MFGYTAAEAVGRTSRWSFRCGSPRGSELPDHQRITSCRAADGRFGTRAHPPGRPAHPGVAMRLDEKAEERNAASCSKVVRDVTRQRRADERERRLLADAAAANAKFQAFFEQGALLAVIMELDGTVVAANRLSWEGCGYTAGADRRQAVLGRSLVGVLARAGAADRGGVRAGDRRLDVPRRDALLRGRRQRADRGHHDRADQGRGGKRAVRGPDGHRHHRPQARRGRSAEVRDARREQHRFHRHVPICRASPSSSTAPGWRWWASTISSRRAGCRWRTTSSRRIGPGYVRSSSPRCSRRATARSRSASGTSRPAKRAGWRTRC